MRKKTKQRTIILVFISMSIVIVAGGVFGLFKLLESQTVISKQVLNEANFTIFYPTDTIKSASSWQLQKDRTSFDKGSGVLTLHATQASTGRQIILNQQPTPGAFTDVPTQYSKMLSTLNEYNELQIGFGTIALSHPKELNGGQTAVANKAGTLIFAKPSANLTDNEWKDFFQNLRILR